MVKRKAKRTIGEMTNSRALWERNPITQVVDNSKKKSEKNRSKVKEKIKRGDYDV